MGKVFRCRHRTQDSSVEELAQGALLKVVDTRQDHGNIAKQWTTVGRASVAFCNRKESAKRSRPLPSPPAFRPRALLGADKHMHGTWLRWSSVCSPGIAFGLRIAFSHFHMITRKNSPSGMSAFATFLFFGAIMAALAGTTLFWPGSDLDRIWVLNLRAYNKLAPMRGDRRRIS